MTPPTDNELMLHVRDGNVGQLARLFERHHYKLYNFYLRMTGAPHLSEDLVQEVFFRILKFRHTFRGDGEFTTWMYHIARNVHRDHFTKWKNEQSAAGEDQNNLPAEEPLAQEQLEQKQNHEFLRRALARLPAEKREILIMSRYQDLRYEAIADILGCSVDAVKVRVHRAMNQLRGIFFELSGEKRI